MIKELINRIFKNDEDIPEWLSNPQSEGDK